jgi:hypothetical protein
MIRERAHERRVTIVDALFARLDDQNASAADREAAARTILERVLGRPGEDMTTRSEVEDVPIDWAALADEIRGLPEADGSQDE